MKKHPLEALVNILLVEQEPDYVRVIGAQFKEHKLRHCLHTVGDEVEALAYLCKYAPYQKTPIPQLILLNANSCDHICEAAVALNDEAIQRHIPVVVFTGFEVDCECAMKDFSTIELCRSKPIDQNWFHRILQLIELYSQLVLQASREER